MSLIAFLAHFVLALALASAANRIGLRNWRRSSALHWTERARVLWPARVTAVTNLVAIPLVLDAAHRFALHEVTGSWLANGLAACAGAFFGNWTFDRCVHPELTFRKWLLQAIAIWGPLLGTGSFVIGATALMPSQLNWTAAALIGGYLMFHFALQFGLVLKLLQWVRFLRSAQPRLSAIAHRVSGLAGISPRAVWEMDGTMAQAFAFPTTRELAFSRRLLELCSDEEVAAVCAHEVAHLTESRIVLAGRLVGSLSLLPCMFFAPSVHYLGLVGLLVPVIGFVGISRFSRWLSHRMEKRADQQAVARQVDEGVFAQALEKIYRANYLPAVNINNRQTHPHLYDRMLAAGVTPEYPRPQRPARMTPVGLLLIVAFASLAILSVMRA